MNYYKHPAMSRSALIDLEKITPYKWYLKHIEKSLKQSNTKALTFGSCLHTAILEPHLYDDLYCYNPYDMRTKQGKEFAKENSDKIMLSKSDNELISNMISSISNHPASKIIADCQLKEENFFFKLDGVDFKARLDCVDTKNHVIYDLKTVQSAYLYDMDSGRVDDKFFRDMSKYGCDSQVYIYSKAYEDRYGVVPRFVFICVEKSAPYEVQVIDVQDNFKECGKIKTHRLLDMYKKLVAGGEWVKSNLWAEAPTWAEPELVLEGLEGFDDESFTFE